MFASMDSNKKQDAGFIPIFGPLYLKKAYTFEMKKNIGVRLNLCVIVLKAFLSKQSNDVLHIGAYLQPERLMRT